MPSENIDFPLLFPQNLPLLHIIIFFFYHFEKYRQLKTFGIPTKSLYTTMMAASGDGGNVDDGGVGGGGRDGGDNHLGDAARLCEGDESEAPGPPGGRVLHHHHLQ